MMDKKIILSILLVLCIAFSVSAVTAAVSDDDVVAETNNDIADDVVAETNNYVSSAVDDSPIVSAKKTEETGTCDGLYEKITTLDDGDELSLKENSIYDVNGTKFTISASNVIIRGKNTTINVNGTAQKGDGATFTLEGKNITLYGIIFNNINGKIKYGDTISGYAIITSKNSEQSTIDNCSFLNFNSGVYVSGSTNVKITNSYFNGSATKVTDTGKKETGTKAINAMGAQGLLVENNTFEGQVLDGVSFASNGNNLVVRNNTFKDNCYAIYFGGKSTAGVLIENNKFINCGYCDMGSEGIKYRLPVISAQKSGDGYKILNNEFIAGNDSYLIKTEGGNTAHGYPSAIGNITISGNNVTVVVDVNPKSVTFVHILSNEGPLNPFGPIDISNNNIAKGITHVTVWYNDWGKDENGDILIPALKSVDTSLVITDISTSDKKITVFLKDVNGAAITNAIISYKINGGAAINETTGSDGYLTIANLTEDGIVEISFAGGIVDKTTNINYTASSVSATFKAPAVVEKIVNKTVTVEKIVEKTPEAKVTKLTADKKTFKRKAKTKKFSVTLKTNDGKAIKNKYVSFKIGKKTYVAKTNSKGVATVSVKLTKKGNYTVKVNFDGDAGYKSASKSAKIIVK